MKEIWTGIVLVLAVQLLQCQLYDPSKYSLGNNLVQNFNFGLPAVSTWLQVSGSIPSWTCNNRCDIVNLVNICASCVVNSQQSLDLNSNGNHDTISQVIEISVAGKYFVHVEWLRPLFNHIGQQFGVSINGTIIATAIITADYVNLHYRIKEVLTELPAGNLTLSLQQIGAPIGNNGILVSNVKVQQLLPVQDPLFDKLTNQLILNNITASLNSVPGSRIFFSSILSYLSSFDRLQFYYFHRQNLSYYSEKLLSNVNTLALERGSLLQNLVQNCNNSLCATINNAYELMIEKLDNQKNYTHPDFLQKNQNGIGFFANNLEFFFYELPGIILIYICFSLAFRLLFNYRISKLIRKYAFYGILLLIIFQGNVEQFAFYFFSECRLLYSANVYHKIGKGFMLIFFFFLLIFVVGGLTLFFVYYKKLVKYFMEDCKKITLLAILLESLEKSIFPLIFGAVHALFIDDLFTQTVILGVIEVCYFVTKLVVLRSDVMMSRFKVAMMSVSSLLRLILILTLYLYEKQGLPLVINMIHHDIVWLYIICWAVQSFYDFINFLADIIKSIFQECTEEQDQNKKKESKNRPRKARPVKEGGKQSSKEKKKIEKGKSASKKKDKALVKKQSSPISEQVDRKKSKEKSPSASKSGKSKKEQENKEKSPSANKSGKPKKEHENKEKSPSANKSGKPKKEKENKGKSPSANKSGKPKEEHKSEQNRVVRVKQNNFNIDVTFGEENIWCRFSDPAKEHQNNSQLQRTKKKEIIEGK